MDLTMLECNRKCLEYKKTVIHYGKTVYHYGRWRTFREILRILKEQNVEIYALLMPDENPIINHPGIHYIYGDVCRTESLQPLLDGAESKETVVIHTAGIISIARDVSPDMYVKEAACWKTSTHIMILFMMGSSRAVKRNPE